MLFADANSVQYAKIIPSGGAGQDLLTPFERGGRIRSAFWTFTTSGVNPAAAEFAYLTKIPAGASLLGLLLAAQAGFTASSTCVVELETALATYTAVSAALDTATGFGYTLDWTAAAAASTAPLKSAGLGRLRLNPGVDVVTAKYFRGFAFYVLD